MENSLIVPDSQSFYLPGNRSGCLLLHGFTSMPEEVRPLGDYLNKHGYTVLGARLAGHATHPEDLARIRWTDWLVNIEDGLAWLKPVCDRIFLIGQSLGGMLALLAGARYPVDGVVALSTSYDFDTDWRMNTLRLWSFFIPIIHKGRTPIYDRKLSRRERDYPAYPYFPTRILAEVEDLKAALRTELANIKAPVLMIQSRKDPVISSESAERLFAALPDIPKELMWLENAGHSITMDPQRELAFRKICQFIQPAELTG
jgi:carboxylesterase